MGLLDSLQRRSLENPTVSLSTPGPWLSNLFGSATAAGVTVTPETAISATTVYACIRLISETIASLPLTLYKTDGKAKEKALDHPLYWLLHNEPNKITGSFQWRETEQARLLLWGNSYNEIEYNQAGDIIGLWPLHANAITPYVDGKDKYYKLATKSGGIEILPDYRCLHIPGFGINGLIGLSPVITNKGAIGLSIAAERFGESLFKNGVRSSGALKHPGRLGDIAYANLKNSFVETYSGINNANKPMILEEGMDWVQLGMNPEDAQILETRKFQVSEVARLFNVPPHMIGDLAQATNNNIEQQSLEFVIYCLRSWLVRWESELNRKLLKPEERNYYYFKFIVDGLLRGDIKTRFEAYNLGRNMGMYSTNEIREKEDLNPVAHGDDDYILPLNVGLAGALSVPAQPNTKDATSTGTKNA